MGDFSSPRTWEAARTAAVALGATLVFGLLVTSNSAGYRYGISDQSFYAPAFERAISPDLFPRDRAVLDPQSRLTVADELVAGIAGASGLDLSALFLAGYVLTLLVFVIAVTAIGRGLYASPWTSVALGLALTLRHRIAKTGVNTFEGYFHPRVLTFGLGLLAIGAVLGRRPAAAIVLVATGIAIHPTTGVWFAIWVGVALAAASPRGWRLLAIGALPAAAAAAALLWLTPLGRQLVVMDPAWAEVLAERDYLYPSDWAAGTWAVNLIAPAVIAAAYAWRRRLGIAMPAERAVVIGCAALLAVFAASLPFIEARVALAVQLQPSRVFWQAEALATAYLVWALIESPWPPAGPRVRRRVVLAMLLLASAVRGAYVLKVEHDHALVTVGIPDSDWEDTADWVDARTPRDAHFLVDPDHVFRYGTSFRIAARRDVFLERIKDSAMAMYSRELAMQIARRQRDVGNFNALTEARALQLARAHDLDYLISEQTLRLPEVHREGPLRLYSLRQASEAGSGGGGELSPAAAPGPRPTRARPPS